MPPDATSATSTPAFQSVAAGLRRCRCAGHRHQTRLVVLTGGPGAGKTAVLDLARHRFCEHVRVLPEAATMLFGGGFPRYDDEQARRAAQRAIFAVQREVERAVSAEGSTAVALCDRGTLDGLAYWPGGLGAVDDFFASHATTRDGELARYAAIIHLRTPAALHYDHSNPVRIETAEQARAMDERIAAAWAGHPHVRFIESTTDFIDKAKRALAIIEHELPECCRHAQPVEHTGQAETEART